MRLVFTILLIAITLSASADRTSIFGLNVSF